MADEIASLFQPSENDVQKLVAYAILQVQKNDGELLDTLQIGKVNIYERSLMFRMAHYMQNYIDLCPDIFGDYVVDCEYNLHISNSKVFETDWGEFKNRNSCPLSDLVNELSKSNNKDKYIKFIPDIVVHKRGVDSRNLLVIEIKKVGSRSFQQEQDSQRLKAFTCVKNKQDCSTYCLKYSYGCQIIFCKKNGTSTHTIQYFINGAIS